MAAIYLYVSVAVPLHCSNPPQSIDNGLIKESEPITAILLAIMQGALKRKRLLLACSEIKAALITSYLSVFMS